MSNTATVSRAVLEYIEKETKANPFAIKIIVLSLINAIATEVGKGNEVTIKPLGKFVLRNYKEKKLIKKGMNGNGTIPACKVLRFIPCRRMKQHINKREEK